MRVPPVKFSIVMPIHNEEENLRYTLKSLFDLQPDEVIAVLDNCTDHSKQMLEAYTRKINYGGRLQLLEVNEIPKDWNYRVAYLFRHGYHAARNDAILTTAADIVLDKNIKRHIREFGQNDLKIISFGLIPYPLDRIYFARKLISLILPRSTFSGVFLFSKRAWLETEREEDAKRVLRAQDTLMFRSIRRVYRARHVWTRSLHLRSRSNESNFYYTRGMVSYQVTHRSDLFVFLSSIVYLHPKMFAGYRYAKRMKIKQVR
jgi:glycosyltransferase involved in cell wall biosynthesis